MGTEKLNHGSRGKDSRGGRRRGPDDAGTRVWVSQLERSFLGWGSRVVTKLMTTIVYLIYLYNYKDNVLLHARNPKGKRN